METAKTTLVLLICAVLTLCPAQVSRARADTAQADVSNTRTVSCLVKVTCDRAILPLNLDTIRSLMRSSGIGGKAARDVLGIDFVESLFDIGLVSGDSASAQWSSSFGTKVTRVRSGAPLAMPSVPGGASTVDLAPALPANPGRISDRRSTSVSTSNSRTTAARRAPAAKSGPAASGGGYGGGGYGGYGGSYEQMYSVPRVPATRPPAYGLWTPQQAPVAEQTILFRLSVDLTNADDARPAAAEFMDALIANLRGVLDRAFRGYENELESTLDWAEQQYRRAQEQTKGASFHTPEDAKIREQLDTSADFSWLKSDMPFGEAVVALKNCVDPPLPIVVLWRDLFEFAEIERSTPVGIDGLQTMKLGTALELLMKSLSSGLADLAYQVRGGAITIATADSLPQPPREPHHVIGDISLQALTEQRRQLLQQRQVCEMEVARLEARCSAMEDQIARISAEAGAEVEDDPVMAELRKIFDLRAKEMEKVNLLVEQTGGVELVERRYEVAENEQARPTIDEVIDAEEKLARARMELAQRKEQLVVQKGGDRIARFNDELIGFAVDLSEQRAMLDILGGQIGQIEEQLESAMAFDPQASQLALAAEAVQVAERRINELRLRLANLNPPSVTVFGAD